MPKTEPVRLFKPSGNALTLDGGSATVTGLMASIHKAATNSDNLDVPTLIENLGKVLSRREMSDSFIEKYSRPAISSVGKIDSFVTFVVVLEDWCKAPLGFAYKNDEFAFVSFAFEISSSMFSSIDAKITRCLEGIFGIVHHCYGDSLNTELTPLKDNPPQLFFRDEDTICTVIEDSSSGVFSSRSNITVIFYNREFWNPSDERITEIIES